VFEECGVKWNFIKYSKIILSTRVGVLNVT
jgi:hypothetical protein